MFSLICTCINGWVNNRKAGDLRRYRTHYDVTIMGKTDACLGDNSEIIQVQYHLYHIRITSSIRDRDFCNLDIFANLGNRIWYIHLHSMMTSSNGSIFRVTGLCVRNSPVTAEFPSQRPVTRSFDVFFDLRLNKRLSKQSWGWWFETPSRSLWRHCNTLYHTTHQYLWLQT